MAIQILFAIILLAIVVFISLKILGNVLVGAMLVGLVMAASFVIAGSLPDLQSIPIIGSYIPSLPASALSIATVKNAFYSVDVLGISHDASNNLIVIAANTGQLDITSLNVSVDGQPVHVMNNVPYPMKSRQVTALETDWNASFSNITVAAGNAETTYP